MTVSPEKIAEMLAAAEKATPPLPVPRCTFADHSYPAFTASQMHEYAQTVNAAIIEEFTTLRSQNESLTAETSGAEDGKAGGGEDAMDKPGWKEMAGQSSRLAALRLEFLRNVVETGRTLLDKLPVHWHDDETVEFRDAIEDAEKIAAQLGLARSEPRHDQP